MLSHFFIQFLDLFNTLLNTFLGFEIVNCLGHELLRTWNRYLVAYFLKSFRQIISCWVGFSPIRSEFCINSTTKGPLSEAFSGLGQDLRSCPSCLQIPHSSHQDHSLSEKSGLRLFRKASIPSANADVVPAASINVLSCFR